MATWLCFRKPAAMEVVPIEGVAEVRDLHRRQGTQQARQQEEHFVTGVCECWCRGEIAGLQTRTQQEALADLSPCLREFAGMTFGWPDGGRLHAAGETVRQRSGSRTGGRDVQSGQGNDRTGFRARLNWVSQGQRCGRCSVRRRAERVIRPAREKNRRRRVLVVTTCSPRPMRAVQRAMLWAITCTASQAALAAKRPETGDGSTRHRA